MPGANYMGGRRNAAKARVKDTTGRLEKSFFGQRRLCAASQALGRNNIEGLGGANISLGHAKRKIPPNNDVITSSFIPSPVGVSPSTPRSRRRTEERPEAHSSSSNVGRSKALVALDVSEPMFLRRVLDRILTIPDLAGISRNRTKPTAGTERQPQVSDESSPLQRTKRKRSVSDLYEGSDFLSDDYNMELTGIEIHDDEFSEFADDVQGDVRSSTSSSRDYRSCRYSTSPRRPSSNCTPYSNFYSSEITSWKESHTRLPTSIVFRGLKNSSAKRSITTATYPVEEPTVYGTLFEQADPWDTIGQILGLPNTKPSTSPGEVINEFSSEIDRSEASFETSSAVVETEECEEDLMSTGDIPELQYSPLIGRQLIGLRGSSRCDSQRLDGQEELYRQEEAENVGTALNQSPQLSCEDVEDPPLIERQLIGLQENRGSSRCELRQEELDRQEEAENAGTASPQPLSCEEIAQVSEAGLSGDIEDEQLFMHESVLAIPELQELDGLFVGPSLFELDKDEDEI